MKALLLAGQGMAALRVAEVEAPRPGPGEVLVRLRAAALNHRDLWTIKGGSPGGRPVVPGSDGAGTIEDVGAGVDEPPFSEAVINPSLHWPDDTPVPPGSFEILGSPTNGTLAEYIVVPRENVEPRPPHLSWEEAAALPLSALTGYRALFTVGRLCAGDTVVIPGVGGGTALQTMQLARAAGARTFVTSGSEGKRRRAVELGAGLALPSESSWADDVLRWSGGRGAEVVVESVGAPTWEQSLRSLARGGRLVVYGSTAGDLVGVDLPPLFLSWRSILGTTMGSQAEFQAMLRFVEEHRLAPVIDRVCPLDAGLEALSYLATGQQFGKVVVRMGADTG